MLNKDGPDNYKISKYQQKVLSHVDDNIISVMEIYNYQGHPYLILKCCDVVRISLFYEIFIQYYFGQLFFVYEIYFKQFLTWWSMRILVRIF